MKIILMESIPSLGKAGDVVQVADGYGRNYLLPRNLALEATPGNIHKLEKQRESFLQKARKAKEEAGELAVRIENLSCTLARPSGENEKLFGSVTSMDLQEFLAGQGIVVDRRKILLTAPIKALGTFSVPVKLNPEVTAQMKVNVIAAEPDSPADRHASPREKE